MKLLLIAPDFHGYWRGIERSLAALGMEVETFRYDRNATPMHAVARKVSYELPALVGWCRDEHRSRIATTKAIQCIDDVRPDAVIIVKGDFLQQQLWDTLKSRRTPFVTWQYDELRRTHMGREGARDRGTIASFSKGDVEALRAMGVEAHYVPMGFDDSITVERRDNRAEISLVGARYPNREQLFAKLVSAGVPVRAYGREWSRHPVDRARTLSLRRPDFPAERDITRSESYAVMASSAATLNTHSPDAQAASDGIAMRTFEAAGAGAVQIINRPDVSEFYDPGAEVLVACSDDEVIDAARRMIGDPQLRQRIQKAARERTLRDHTLTERVKTLTELW